MRTPLHYRNLNILRLVFGRVFATKTTAALFLCLFVDRAVANAAGLTIQEAIEEGIATNPLVVSAEGRVDEARGLVQQAGSKPNPRLTLQTEDIRKSTREEPFSFANSTEDYLIVSQVIEGGRKRERRTELASDAVQTAELLQSSTKRQIASRISASYWSAVVAERVVALQTESVATYDEDYGYVENRVREGMAAEADLLRLGLERDRARADLIDRRRAASQALVELFRAMGRTDFTAATLTSNLDEPEIVTTPSTEQVLDARPDLKIARQAIVEAEANIRLQRANAKPDPQASVGYKRNVGYDTLYGAVQIDLPIRNKNQGNIASAEARLRIARSLLRSDEAGARAEVESAAIAYREQLDLLKILPDALTRARESERLARAAYREGGIDLLRLLDAQRSRIQTQLDYYRALAELRRSVLNLRVAAGQDVLMGLKP